MKYNSIILSIFKKKKLLQFSIKTFGLLNILFFFFCTIKIELKETYYQKQEQYISARYINISSDKSYDDMKKDIEKIPEIKSFYPNKTINLEGYYFQYQDERIIELVQGRKIEKYNEVLAPNFLEDYQINDKIIIDGEELIVVGIYEVIKYNYGFQNRSFDKFYISYDFIMDHIQNAEINEMMILLKDYRNLNTVLEQLEEYNIGRYDGDTSILEKIIYYYKKINLFQKILFIFFVIFITISSHVIVHDNHKDFAILKSMGYSNISISYILFVEIFLFFLLTFIPCMIVNIILSKIDILSISSYFSLFIVSSIIVVILHYFKIKKMQVIKELKSS